MTDDRDQAGVDESRRLAALQALALLDSEPEREFDSLVTLAADLLACPTALLTLIDRDRQWIKASSSSLVSTETPRHFALCNTTIRRNRTYVVEDAATDPTLADNPLIAEIGLRFYAGAPIHVVDGDGERQPIGALCVIDTSPRSLNEAGHRTLAHLATLAEALIAARAVAREAVAIASRYERQSAARARQDRVMRQAERLAGMGWWRFELESGRLEWSDGVYHLHQLPVGSDLSVERALDHYPPASRARVSTQLALTAETGEMFDIEEDFLTATGDQRRIRAIGELERVDGRPSAVLGVFQDVTEQHRMENMLRRLAETDPLTGIANRAAFDRALSRAIERAHANRTPLILALVDLDNFKAINDTLGHPAGDEVLRLVAQALSEPWLAGSFAARLGGDEFGLIVTDLALAANPANWLGELDEAMRVSVSVDGLTMACAGSVGIARLEADHDARDLMHRADTILYAAKRARVGNRRRGERRRAG